jgi:hypothetical protein
VSRARFGLCRETPPVPAVVRQSQNVPVSYPRNEQFSSKQATLYAHLQGFCENHSDGLEPSTPSLPWKF